MKPSISVRLVACAALATAALGAASAARAGNDVTVSFGWQGHPGHVAPAPVYVVPHTGFPQLRAVHVEPRPVYVQPRPVLVAPRGWQDARYDRYDRYEHYNHYDREERERAWRRAERHRQHWKRHHGYHPRGDDHRGGDRHRPQGHGRD